MMTACSFEAWTVLPSPHELPSSAIYMRPFAQISWCSDAV